MQLPKQVFLALAAIGWVDGSLQRIEAIGLMRAAKEAGLTDEELLEVEHASKTPSTIDAIDLSGMSERDQVMTYALAAWIAQVDGVVSTEEHHTVTTVGDKLGLPDALRKRAAIAVYDIVCLPKGGRPETYDFAELAKRIQHRIPQLGA
jgi:hypothetical protein